MDTSAEHAVDGPSERRKVRVRVRARKRSRRHRRRQRLRRVTSVLLIVLGILIVLGVVALFPALETGTRLRDARGSMQAARSALLQGQAGKARKAFERAHGQFQEARSSVRHPLIRLFGFLPVVGRSPDATTALVEAGLRVAEAGRTLAIAVEDLPGGPAALAPQDGEIPVEPLRQLAGPLGKADGLLDEAGTLMAEAPEHWLAPPVADGVREFEPLLEEARTTVGTAAALTRVLPAFLGDDGPKRYFVAAQNPAELRGTGGLIGSYSILTVRDGALEFGDFRPVSELDTIPPGRVEPPNPDYARVWDRYESRGYWSNINMTADFPSAAVAIERLYEETEGVRLDGVIATDPFALAALLRVVGPVDVPGTDVILDPKNAVDFLTHDAYSSLQGSARKFLLGDAAEEVLSRFIGGPVGGESEIPRPGEARLGPDAPPSGGRGTGEGRTGGREDTRPGTGDLQMGEEEEDPGPGAGGPAIEGSAGAVAFGRVLVEIAADGHLLLHAADPGVQQVLRDVGIAGQLPDRGGDVIALVSNNAAGNKIDFFLKQTAAYTVELQPDGGAETVAALRFRNTAPTAGEPRYVIGPHPETDFQAGDANLLVSTYCAPTCVLERFERNGDPDEIGSQVELDHPLYSALVHMPAGGSERLVYGWVASSVWNGSGGRGVYRLTYHGQGGIIPPEVEVEIVVPPGYQVTGVSAGMEALGDRAVWKGPSQPGVVLEVEFQRPFLGRIWQSIVDFLNRPISDLG